MTMSPGVLVLLACALVLVALGLWLWGRSQHAQQHKAVQSHLQQSLQRRTPMESGASAELRAVAASVQAKASRTQQEDDPQWLRTLRRKLAVDAWGIGQRGMGLIAVLGCVLVGLAALQGGAVMAAAALLLYMLLVAFGLWRRVMKLRQRVLEQLPGFLDNMVRLITIGNSPQAAFQMATDRIAAPLGDALAQATSMLSVGIDMGSAMEQLERRWGVPEFGLLAAVFRMSTRYGGRTDHVLERVSAYIRDRQSAEQELHALSTEVRLSAWILSLLPLVVGGMIMLLNGEYFLRMWNDDSGKQMILIAAGLQVTGCALLYRLAKLR